MGMCEPALEILADAFEEGDRASSAGHGLDDLELSYDVVDHLFMYELRDRERAVSGLGRGSA